MVLHFCDELVSTNTNKTKNKYARLMLTLQISPLISFLHKLSKNHLLFQTQVSLNWYFILHIFLEKSFSKTFPGPFSIPDDRLDVVMTSM